MNDKVVKIEFNIWANSEDEGKQLTDAICGFVDGIGQMGIKVSASKVIDAISRWQSNPLVKRSIINHFK